MDRTVYKKIENYMLECMDATDFVHGREHVYRVLSHAVEIADHITAEENLTDPVDYDVLIAAALLHDIGRAEQNENLELCHAQIGSAKAYNFLLSLQWPESRAKKVSDCILSHRARKGEIPAALEARILFDADKLDSIGAIGISRILMYSGRMKEPLYTLTETGQINREPSVSEVSNFFQEWNQKKATMQYLNTSYAKQMAKKRMESSEQFYISLLKELESCLDTCSAEKLC